MKPTLHVLDAMCMLAAILAMSTSFFTSNTFLVQAQGGQGMSGMGGMMEHGGQGMSGMGGMMEHGGQGMSGMGGMMEHSAPGSVNQVCSVEDHMPPHYCEPSYQVMSSVKGVKITDVTIVNDTSIVLTVRELNPTSNNTVGDIVIVGGGGDLAGSSLLDGNWNESTTAIINFVGTGSVYSTDRLMIHLFPFSEQT
jgi:hypothetical protein